MTYEVRLTARAERDLEEAYRWYRERAAGHAERWYNGFLDALVSLERAPQSFPLIPERENFREEVRHLLYGRRRSWRAIFVVRGGTVLVLHIRHSSRHTLSPDDLP
ncbi:MAG TPA: type II toxin-antitoxin system RelE/ParE family toxin [Planctomycetaceae bacterium]